MPYSSYNAYIVQSNLSVIVGIVVANHLSTVLNIKPFLFILNWFYFQIAEYLLVAVCSYNIYRVSKGVINPYLSNIHLPFNNYFFTPGPLVKTIYKAYCLLFNALRGKKIDTPPAPTAPAPQPPKDSYMDTVFSTFLNPDICNNTTTYSDEDMYMRNTNANNSQAPSTANVYETQTIDPQIASGINLTTYSMNNTLPQTSVFGNVIPKLKYTPCLRPPLEPSAYRERILWYLSPTPEVVEDFRIEQVLGFQKNWHRFNDRFSRTYYDKLTAALLKYIFTPLADSIDSINKKLPANQTIATCSPGAVALSFLMPEFNSGSIFTMAEVLKFLTLETHASSECIQYVSERVKELASNKKMAAYTYTPKRPGMPTDSAIIMHIFKNYLVTKEPYAIPPLIPEEIDLFKFLLVYVYMTPELDHWKVFERR